VDRGLLKSRLVALTELCVHQQNSVDRSELKELPAIGARCSIRVIKEGSEVILVYEPEIADASRRLIFESASGQIAITKFPVTWRALGEKELLLLRGD
jgi:hypothetical protein